MKVKEIERKHLDKELRQAKDKLVIVVRSSNQQPASSWFEIIDDDLKEKELVLLCIRQNEPSPKFTIYKSAKWIAETIDVDILNAAIKVLNPEPAKPASRKRRRSNSTARSVTSLSSIGSVSMMSPEVFAKYTGVEVSKIPSVNKIGEILTIKATRPSELSELFQEVYKALDEETRETGYPNRSTSEAHRSGFVRRLISEVIKYIKKRFGVPDNRLRRVEQARIEFENRNLTNTVVADFLISDEAYNRFLAAFECKVPDPRNGLLQCAAYLIAIFKDREKPVYGLYTDGIRYSLLSYDGVQSAKGFKVFDLEPKGTLFMFKEMFEEEESKKLWFEKSTILAFVPLPT